MKIRPVGAVLFHANGQTDMLLVNTRPRSKTIQEYVESKFSCFPFFLGGGGFCFRGNSVLPTCETSRLVCA